MKTDCIKLIINAALAVGFGCLLTTPAFSQDWSAMNALNLTQPLMRSVIEIPG